MQLSLKCALLAGVFLILICKIEQLRAESVYVQELKSNWILTNGSYTTSKVKIPSGVYSILYGDDVLYSYNDVNLRWISYSDWKYTLAFTEEIKHRRLVNITFHGIDTVAEIRLNHQLLGRTDNMFVRYSYDVTKILEEENLLEVDIKSPVRVAKELANVLEATNSSVPPYCPNSRYHGECHMNLLRKMQASFAWDWGLAAPSMGIWKSVALEFYEVALLRDVDVAISKNDTHWNMHIRAFIDAGGKSDFFAVLKFYAVEFLNEVVIIDDYQHKRLSYRNPVITFDQAVPIEKVKLWWPNGYGDQILYPLHFTLQAWLDANGPSLRARTTSQKSISVGFRTIELVEDPVREGTGNTFLFKVNGVEMFMKGTNYIPSHILPEEQADEARIQLLLQSAKEQHANMIRVWGGGVYESDYFYNLADQYGILIWQDMMFACAMYPVSTDFLASVRTEVSQNAKRIAYHPSLAIFAGNNENEAALVEGWYETYDRTRFDREYRELYLGNVLHELKIIEHSSRPMPLVSSPSIGKYGAMYNFISPNPQDEHYGDVHFYSNFRDDWDFTIYPQPRFASEYGVQSLPSMQSWKRVLGTNDDLGDLMDHRQHHPTGMELLITLVRRHLPLPLPEDDNYIEALIYFSQIAQAMATKIETEHYRSLRDTEYRTMGALYWQLNDVWVAPSWSSIDFLGNYKLLHYWAKEFMAPIAITALFDERSMKLSVNLICDQVEVNSEGLEVSASIFLWPDIFPANRTTWPVTLKPNGVQYDKVLSYEDIFRGPFTDKNSFVQFTLHNASTVISETYFFPSPFQNTIGLRDPELKVDVSNNYCYGIYNEVKRNVYSLSITARSPALFVYIEIPKLKQYKLSRNGYVQAMPIQVVRLEFDSSSCIDITRSDVKMSTVNQYV